MAIILLPNCTMLYYVFSGPLSLRAYVPEIKFNNDCIEDFGELTHTPFTKVFECLSRYAIWATAPTILHFVQLSVYLFTRDFIQRTFGLCRPYAVLPC